MPVWELLCPDCGHTFRSFVMDGARVPPVWVCSSCGGRQARATGVGDTGPFSAGSGPSCGCGCG